MPDAETMVYQQELLATYRRSLAHLLQQAAEYGGEAFAPPQVANGIVDARAHIRQIKTTLRECNVSVEDDPNDEPPHLGSVSSPRAGGTQINAQGSPGSIGHVPGSTSQSFDEQYSIYTGGGIYTSTDGGDYAGRDLDKRQGGAFVEGRIILGDVMG